METKTEAITAYIEAHSDELIALLQKMVQTRSINPAFDPTSAGEGAMAALVKSQYDRLGIPVELVEAAPGRPNVIATVKGEGGGPRLLVNCHLDTHAGNVGEWIDPYTNKVVKEWTHDPFGGEIVDGIMYGRGSVDHKMPIAATLMALEALKACGVKLKGDVVCIHDADEETGGQYGMKYLAENRPFDFDMALYACTSDMTPLARSFFPAMQRDNIIHSFSGWHTYRIRFQGVNYHNLTAKRGYGGAEAALLFLKRLEPLMERVNAYVCPVEATGQPAMKVSAIDGAPRHAFHHQGLWSDLVVNRRIPPSVDPNTALAEMQELVDAHNLEFAQNGAELSLARDTKIAFTPSDHPVVSGLAQAVRQVTGREPNVAGLAAPVGISQLLGRHKIPTVLFGYGLLNLHHAVDEHIVLQDVIDTAKVYAVAFTEWLGVTE
jgi:acetylornithine deacetylase/succinyl-diaminopimelate desuccinylase-like protein